MGLFRSHRNPACSGCSLIFPQALTLLHPYTTMGKTEPSFVCFLFLPRKGWPSSSITNQGLQILLNLPLAFQIHSGLPPQLPQTARCLCPELRCLDPSCHPFPFLRPNTSQQLPEHGATPEMDLQC